MLENPKRKKKALSCTYLLTYTLTLYLMYGLYLLHSIGQSAGKIYKKINKKKDLLDVSHKAKAGTFYLDNRVGAC
jgi:hypothetical protein